MKNTMKEFWSNITWDRKTIGLMSGLISQLAFVLMTVLVKIDVLAFLMMGLWLAGLLVCYVTLGKYVFPGVFGVAKKLFVAGWLFVPFPIDIVTGLVCSTLAISVSFVVTLYLPGILALSDFFRARNAER